ncbi:hypothetical protein [Comamonas sp. JC664]|uniref:hypothetical protein n=1 Tax=Comamonas sp. JC664 TaxID=2801917 RepID=UPI00174C9A49|nr:hypothetical protein [Comamonas sp. JC664]MBL0698580.1 hypothetical protein [Comamonas sp. JC664]GHH00566.1 hypothetical protein GCM10012319_67860 [Comamonas sp. KCTC 72670]
MSKIGERLPSVATPKTKTEVTGPGTKGVSTQQWVDLLGGLIPAQGVTKTTPASTFAAQALGATTASHPAFGKEVLPSALGPLTDERMARCVTDAYREIFRGDRLPTGPERSKWMDFARKMRADNPKVTADEIRYAIQDQLRLERDGLHVHSKANTDRFIAEAVCWVTRCYEGEERGATDAEMKHWRAFAEDLMKKNPEMTPEALKYAIVDAVRAKVMGTDAITPENIDKYIQDAVKWVTRCYEDGKEREATPAEMKEWRAFAQQQMKENKDISPEDLRLAIVDTMREKMTGTGAATPMNIDKFIDDAVKWVSLCYEGKERRPTAAELGHWRDHARKLMKENPDMKPEELRLALNEAVRVKVTGMDNTGSANIDRFIHDAVKWVTLCYDGHERPATPEELRKWRAFANEKKKENKDISPEELRLAIQDAIRSEKMGTDGPPGENIERFIREAYAWLVQTHYGYVSDRPNGPTQRELTEWAKFARDKLKETPEMTSEDMRHYILDSLRTALANQ